MKIVFGRPYRDMFTRHVQRVTNLMQRIFGGGHIPTEI